jgi:hypothetical protein
VRAGSSGTPDPLEPARLHRQASNLAAADRDDVDPVLSGDLISSGVSMFFNSTPAIASSLTRSRRGNNRTDGWAMKADVAVVGGGAIGVCCALELARRGAGDALRAWLGLAASCSAGNAGLICPSHSGPIEPDLASNGLR